VRQGHLQGVPKPLLLKLHRESTFTDMEYLAGQVFPLHGHVLAPSVPLAGTGDDPVLRPHRRAARPTAACQKLNSDIVSSPALRDKRWFL
jgi:hypothetical protein